jgi:hypothetical protein
MILDKADSSTDVTVLLSQQSYSWNATAERAARMMWLCTRTVLRHSDEERLKDPGWAQGSRCVSLFIGSPKMRNLRWKGEEMPQRICDHCGKMKDLGGGKTCENGHFFCKDCVVHSTVFTTTVMKQCPLDKKPLR